MRATNIVTSFLREEQAQDLIEYTLLLAFVVLASVGLFIGVGSSVAGVWDETSEVLVRGNRTAAS